jgi:uncharacterized protein YjbJ (UPF0337 family)
MSAGRGDVSACRGDGRSAARGTVEKRNFQPIRFSGYNLENFAMDKDRVVGSAKEVKGLVKETIGKATGDAKLQADGKADKVEGKIQNAIGGAKDAVRDALKE